MALFKQKTIRNEINVVVVVVVVFVAAFKKRHTTHKCHGTYYINLRVEGTHKHTHSLSFFLSRFIERERKVQCTTCDCLPLFIRWKSETRFHRFCEDDNRIRQCRLRDCSTTQQITQSTSSQLYFICLVQTVYICYKMLYLVY